MNTTRMMLSLCAAALVLSGCAEDTSTDTASEYDTLQPDDVELDFHITGQHYLVVWNAGWAITPDINNEVNLEPGSEWTVTYETTAPDVTTFTGETYSFTVLVNDAGEISTFGNGLKVGTHAVNAHPDRLIIEITDVTELAS
jgi:hypothetical protein